MPRGVSVFEMFVPDTVAACMRANGFVCRPVEESWNHDMPSEWMVARSPAVEGSGGL